MMKYETIQTRNQLMKSKYDKQQITNDSNSTSGSLKTAPGFIPYSEQANNELRA